MCYLQFTGSGAIRQRLFSESGKAPNKRFPFFPPAVFPFLLVAMPILKKL